jgi:hypothetical protein
LIRKPVRIHNEPLSKVLLTGGVSASSHSGDTDKPACHICGTKRQRNLIISFCKAKHQSMSEYLVNPESGDRHVICYRCDALNLSGDDLRYMKDRYFPKGDMRRYKDLEQKCKSNAHKRAEGCEE